MVNISYGMANFPSYGKLFIRSKRFIPYGKLFFSTGKRFIPYGMMHRAQVKETPDRSRPEAKKAKSQHGGFGWEQDPRID